jgi:hypothetical protein
MRVRLSIALMGLAVWVVPVAAQPRPTEEEEAHLLEHPREVALNYSKSLPDFICTQVIRRSVDPYGRNVWRELDILTVKLSYFEQRENYQLILINQKPAEQDYRSVGGAFSEGEFGSTLRGIFDRASATEFHWKSWTNIRKRRAAVYHYRVEQSKSRYRLSFAHDPKHWMEAVTGYHGEVHIDRETNMVLRLTSIADIPASFPMQESVTELDYDYIEVGGREFLLPLRAEVRMQSFRLHTKNEVDFREYRKFSSEATITFDK